MACDELRLANGIYPPADAGVLELIEQITLDQPPRRSIVRAACTSWADFESFGIIDALDREGLDIGHRLQVLLHWSALTATASDPRLERLDALGAEVRVTHRSLPDMVVLGAEVIAAARKGSDQDERHVVHVRSRELGTILLGLLGALWEHAEDVASARRSGAIRTDTVQATVLMHLCAGILDDTAAREMGISVRTYRRHVAGILRDLDVTSRFQAGVKAAGLGLLSGL